jgi:hypothetical protein
MFALATVFMTLGTIYGYILKGRPVLWAIIGFFIGGALGYLADFLIQRKKVIKEHSRGKGAEVIMIIHFHKEQVQKVKEILFEFCLRVNCD